MKKGLVLIAALLAAVLTLTGCNLVGYDEALDDAQVVARVGDTEITKSEWKAYRDYLASYYEQYYAQYFGISMPVTDETLEAYGEEALQMMIESAVEQAKMKEYGFDPLDEEHAAEVEQYADTMVDFYKQLLRWQNYADIETVEEEYARLTEATPSEATPAEETPSEPVQIDPSQLVATVTDAELDAMLENDLAAAGYTREYFVTAQTSQVQSELLRAEVVKDVAVTDEEVRAEFDSRVSQQQTSYDATPTLYASAVSNGSDVYYTPAGYRGVKNLLIKVTDEDQAEIDALNDELTAARDAKDSAQRQLDELNQEDTSELDEEGKAAYDEEVAALTQQVTDSDTTIAEKQTALEEKTEAAFAAILPRAQEALERLNAGEDFDALLAEYGEDGGMNSEPEATRGYLVCDGLTQYVTEFQEAAMALGKPGDTSDLVRTSYGYHILKYETDIEPGVCEFTDEIAEDIRGELLEQAQDAAYEAAVSQWVSEADVKTYPKAMK